MNVLNYARRAVSWQTNITARTRDDVLKEMVDTLCTKAFLEANPELSPADIFRALMDREELRTTAVGELIAIPHARLNKLNSAFFAMATLPEAVLFSEEPVRIVCMILSPASDPSLSLKMMAQLSRMLTEGAVREQVLAAKTSEQLQGLFDKNELECDAPVCARDIMRLPRWSVKEDTLISECAQMMGRDHLRALPVLNDQKQVLGEITADQLFRYGLPDFFDKLKSVSFIAEFDPFEKYFEDERNTPVRDVMTPDARTVPLDYTLMEVVFDLAVLRFTKLYVTDEENRWIGTIDQGTVLNNVINY